VIVLGLAWVQGIATILNDDVFLATTKAAATFLHCSLYKFTELPSTTPTAHLSEAKMQAQRIDTANFPKSFMMKSRISLATQGGGLAR